MAKKSKKSESTYTQVQLKKAFEAAYYYYIIARKEEDRSLPKQEEIAKIKGMRAPRFSEYLNIAWKTGMIDVRVRPRPEILTGLPEEVRYLEISADAGARDKLEKNVQELLNSYSPKVKNDKGELITRFKKAHVVPNLVGRTFNPGEKEGYLSSDYSSVATRISRRAAKEFAQIIAAEYSILTKSSEEEKLYCGIGWGPSCESIVDFFQMPKRLHPNLIVCPFTGMISIKQHSLDANFLAFRLASRLSGEAIKIPGPVVQDYGMGIDKLKPIKEALEHIAKCTIGISALGVPFDKKNRRSRLMLRDFYTEEQTAKVEASNAVTEINCSYLDADGYEIDFKELGFEPLGVSVSQMKRMKRYMVVVSPDSRKIPGVIATVKSGICTDLVLDHRMAHEILAKYSTNTL